MKNPDNYPVKKTDTEWREQLSANEYKILREKGTEYPFTGLYNNHFDKGTYACKGCNALLYESENKFDSACGWPSYNKAIPGAITYIKDNSHGMIRTEIVCSSCGCHQGHVFDDGQTSTGRRYCVNSASIIFRPKEK